MLRIGVDGAEKVGANHGGGRIHALRNEALASEKVMQSQNQVGAIQKREDGHGDPLESDHAKVAFGEAEDVVARSHQLSCSLEPPPRPSGEVRSGRLQSVLRTVVRIM